MRGCGGLDGGLIMVVAGSCSTNFCPVREGAIATGTPSKQTAGCSEVGYGIDLLDDPGGGSNRDGEVRDILGHDAARANCATFADGDAGHDGRVATDPAVVANGHWLRVLDAVSSGLDAGLVSGCEDGHKRTEHDAVTDLDQTTIQDHEAYGAVSLCCAALLLTRCGYATSCLGKLT